MTPPARLHWIQIDLAAQHTAVQRGATNADVDDAARCCSRRRAAEVRASACIAPEADALARAISGWRASLLAFGRVEIIMGTRTVSGPETDTDHRDARPAACVNPRPATAHLDCAKVARRPSHRGYAGDTQTLVISAEGIGCESATARCCWRSARLRSALAWLAGLLATYEGSRNPRRLRAVTRQGAPEAARLQQCAGARNPTNRAGFITTCTLGNPEPPEGTLGFLTRFDLLRSAMALRNAGRRTKAQSLTHAIAKICAAINADDAVVRLDADEMREVIDALDERERSIGRERTRADAAEAERDAARREAALSAMERDTCAR